MVSRIPILQTCNCFVVWEQRLASFQHLHNYSLRSFRSRRGCWCSSVLLASVVETAGVSIRTLSSGFPLKTFSHFSFNADISPLTFDQYSRLNSLILGLEIASSCRLVNNLSYHFPQIDSSVSRDLDSKLFRTLKLHSVQTFQDILLSYLTCSDPILYRNLERHRYVSKY